MSVVACLFSLSYLFLFFVCGKERGDDRSIESGGPLSRSLVTTVRIHRNRGKLGG